MKRIVIALVLLTLTFPVYSVEENAVKLAAAAEGKTPSGLVSSSAARCTFYLIFDGQGDLEEVIENPYKESDFGAGFSVAQLLAQKKVTIIIAGNIGNKMRTILEEKDISFFEFTGTIENAVKEALKTVDRP